MKTLRKIIRCIIVFAILFVIIGAFGSKLNTLFMEHHTYSEWWFWLLVIIAGIFAYVWVMQDSSGNESETPKKKGRDYGREYTDCNRAWQLIHKNGWNADDFTEAQQLLQGGHLRYTNNGDYIKELNKKITQESLKCK